MQKKPREPLPWNTPAHDAALYPTLKWHLYLLKLSFDSLPHTEPQITFNTDIKSRSKICLGRLEGRVQGTVVGYIYISYRLLLSPARILAVAPEIHLLLTEEKKKRTRQGL